MKKYTCLLMLVASTLYFSHLNGQETESTIHQDIFVTFINSTGTDVDLNIDQFHPHIAKPPWKFLPIKKLNLTQGQIESIRLPITFGKDGNTALSISGTAKNYGGAGSSIKIDIAQSDTYNIELTNEWVYPGQELWPPVDPFPVIIAKPINLNDLNAAKARADSAKPIQFEPFKQGVTRKKMRQRSKPRKTLMRKKNVRRKRRKY